MDPREEKTRRKQSGYEPGMLRARCDSSMGSLVQGSRFQGSGFKALGFKVRAFEVSRFRAASLRFLGRAWRIRM